MKHVLPEEWKTGPHTYFFYALGAKAIKIGYSTNFYNRLATTATYNPHEILPVAAISGGQDKERAAHKTLRSCRMRGEWFRDCPQVWNYMERHAEYIYDEWMSSKSDAMLPVSSNRFLYDDNARSAHDELIAKEISEAINRVGLTARERDILNRRRELCGKPMTLEQLSAKHKVSGARISQIERDAINKLLKSRELVRLAIS